MEQDKLISLGEIRLKGTQYRFNHPGPCKGKKEMSKIQTYNLKKGTKNTPITMRATIRSRVTIIPGVILQAYLWDLLWWPWGCILPRQWGKNSTTPPHSQVCHGVFTNTKFVHNHLFNPDCINELHRLCKPAALYSDMVRKSPGHNIVASVKIKKKDVHRCVSCTK